MSILYVRCTEGQLLRRQVEASSVRVKNLHRVSSIVLLVVASEISRKLMYAAVVNRAQIKTVPRSASTATLAITVDRYTKRPATEHDKSYALASTQSKHVLTAPAVRAELSWSK